MWLVRVGGTRSKLAGEYGADAQRDALDRALSPRVADDGELSVFEVRDAAEANEVAALHLALGGQRPANVDYILLPESALEGERVEARPDARHPSLDERHRVIVGLNDEERRAGLVDRLMACPDLSAQRVGKQRARELVLDAVADDRELRARLRSEWL